MKLAPLICLGLTALIVIGLLGISNGESLSSPETYRMGPSDVIRVQVYGEEDLSVERKVGGDGKIDYPLLGSIGVAGRTIEEIQVDLTTRLSAGYLKHPKITVSIAKHRNFYVSGEVKTAGAYPYEDGLTVQKAISVAGGFTERASKTDVRVERHHERDVALIPVEPTALILPDDLIVVATAQRFYVNGEVKKPGDYGYERGLTLHMAITMAGGFTEKASKSPKVLRMSDGKEQSIELPLDALILPGDVIVVAQRFF